MGSPKARSKKAQPPGSAGGQIEVLASRLVVLASNAKNWQERSGEAEKLATRRGTLQQYQAKLDGLKAAIVALGRVRAMEPARGAAIRGLRGQRDAVHALAERCAEDANHVTRAKALDGLRSAEWDAVESALLAAWQGYLGAGAQSGLESVLSRFPKLRGEAKRVGEARRDLQARASTLPRSDNDVAECEEARSRLGEVLAEVDGSGVDAEILAFLKGSVAGVSLEHVLGNQRIIAWLAQQGLAGQFSVRSL
jgi:hypothetical protein